MAPIVLVGMMGVGKTTIGRKLAQRRGVEFVDLDAVVEAVAGRTISEIWADEGEAGFRSRESNALREFLVAASDSVAAAGGGVVVDAWNRDLLRARAHTVWLRARPDTLARRVGDARNRPLLAGEAATAGTLAALVEQRSDLYESAASLVVDVDGLTPQQAADAIEDAVAEWVRVEE